MIAIIGAGISGLTTAWYLQKNNIKYRIFEASERAGGYIQSKKEGNFLLELGPNSILCDKEIIDMMTEMGLKRDFLFANPSSKSRFIFKNGAYRKLPSSPPSLIFNTFFSWKTKLAIWKERNNKTKGTTEETLSQFFERRFSKEIVEYALNPFVAGIFAGDPKKLILEKTFPVLREHEQKHGSVIKGFIANKGAERKESISFKEGLERLPAQIAQQLRHISYQSPILDLKKEEKGFILTTPSETVHAEQVILTTSAFTSADLLGADYADFSLALHALNYPSMCVIHSVFNKEDVGFDMEGFGGLNPACENTFSAGSIWSSSLFEGRCRSKQILITSFVGGVQFQQQALLPEKEILEKLTQELQTVYQIKGKPIYQHFKRWKDSIPQYDKQILSLDGHAQKAEKDKLWICANWKDGVSIGDCMKKAKKLAESLS
jgi:oxygen-dependent protoporphyrinogen oxidase